MPECCVALGGNLGDVPATLRAAAARLREQPGIRSFRSSRLFHTAPVGDQAGTGFFNAAWMFETDLLPLDVLRILRDLESEFGRSRTTFWSPRTIDLDLAFYGSQSFHLPSLTVPHPGAWYRRFVLDPLCDLWPEAWHPTRRCTIQELRRRLEQRPLPVGLAGCETRIEEWTRELIPKFPDVRFVALRSAGLTLSEGPRFPGPDEIPLVLLVGGEPPSAMDQTTADLNLLTGPQGGPLSFDDVRYILISALDRPVPAEA